MWKRFASLLRCPLCVETLELTVFEEARATLSHEHVALAERRGVSHDDLAHYIESGLLSCHRCALWFPIFHGLPILLPYTTPLHDEFSRELGGELAKILRRYSFPSQQPAPGERFVLRSFSTEWLEYDFDGVIWEMDYDDHERRFFAELGPYRPTPASGPFIEMGCGIGITTYLAQKNFGVDAVGVDLSLAALRAATHYRTNPFLHFVQGSVFYLPFATETFGTIYSRGVLHHTHSTRKAFISLVRYCRPGGTTYVWVYGPRSINDNAFRRGIYAAERVIRTLLGPRASGPLSAGILIPLAIGYMAFNRVRRWTNPSIQAYNLRRALHAARDRFTPEYAYRHDHREVVAWFQEAGFEAVEVVDWRAMPSADHDDYQRNTGVRGRKALVSP